MFRGLLVIGVLLPSACGYFGGSRPAPAAHPPPQARSSPQADAQSRALAGMVDAVGPSQSQSPVNLMFSIRDRPQVGEDDEIDYALVPNVAGLESLQVAFAPGSGLQVITHGPPLAAVKPLPGTPILGSVTVRPVEPGLFILSAVVAVQSPDRSVVWPFTIPVIVGEGPAQTAANQQP